LRWAVTGCLEWQRQGLKPPAVVLEATSDYLAAEDTFGLWMSDCCIRGDHEERSGWLYESNKRWRQIRGELCPSQKAFSTTLTERGFRLVRDSQARRVAGIRLTDEERSVVQKIVAIRKRQRVTHDAL